MKKYFSFLRLKFCMSLQYRAAAFAGIITQFIWGIILILMYKAFYQTDATAFPMSFQATVNYIWLEEATLALFMVWTMDNEIFDLITSGNVAYELCRPLSVYNMWFAKNIGSRYAKAILRCIPILVIAMMIPSPYRLTFPSDFKMWLLFIISLILSSLVTVAMCMLIYIACFFTVSAVGVRMLAVSIFEFFQGNVIPIPFFPEKLSKVMELLPFGSMQNVPFRIFSGDIAGSKALTAISMQVIWLVIIVALGKGLMAKAMKKICMQGG